MGEEKVCVIRVPVAIGPYSQSAMAGNMVFVSGQLPIDPETGAFAGNDISSQTRQSLQNIAAILSEKEMGMDSVVKTTVLLKSMRDFDRMNEVYNTFFKQPYPARAAFQVAMLPKNALVEIEAVAVKK